MTEDRPVDFQQRIQDLEDSLLRQDQLYFDKLNQYAKDLESTLDKVSRFEKENQCLRTELRQKDAAMQNLADQIRLREEKISELSQYLADQIRLREEKISELNQILDVNYLAIQQAQEELELCHMQFIKNRDEHAKSIKKQIFLLFSTLINRSRKTLAGLLPYRVLRRGKQVLERWNTSSY